MSDAKHVKAPEAITQPLPRGVADAIKEAEWLRGHVAAGKTLRIWQKHIVDLDDYAHTLQSSLERTERELREAQERVIELDTERMAARVENQRLREALRKYGDHFPECAVIQESGRAVKPPCNCGFAAALSNPSNPEKGES
jgi:hypothetical protein